MSLKKTQLTGGLTRAAVLGGVLVGVLAGAMVLARRGPTVLATVTDTRPQLAMMASPPAATRVAAAQPRARQATPSRTAAATFRANPPLVMASAAMPAVESPANAAAEILEVITITGCLQHDDGTFRLKDTIGSDAPKARSWKSGFLKKHTASVDVVDSANRLGLPTHVGQRVTVTGILLNREMRARAVQRLGVCS